MTADRPYSGRFDSSRATDCGAGRPRSSCRRARLASSRRSWPSPALSCPSKPRWTRCGRTRSSPRRHFSRRSACCATRSETIGFSPSYIQTVHRRGVSICRRRRAVRQPHADPVARRAEIAGAEWRPLWRRGGRRCCHGRHCDRLRVYGQRPPAPRPTTRFTIALPDDMAIDPLRGSVAVSGDGTRMVYAALHVGRTRLFLRTIDRDTPQAIEGSDGAADPFFSPDGQWVGFFAHGSLKKLRVEGGTPVALCAARPGSGASWGTDKTIVFGGGPGGGLARMSEDGGEPVVLTAPPAGSPEVSYGWPDVLPEGTHVLYTAVSLAGSRVAIFDLRTASVIRSSSLVHSAAIRPPVTSFSNVADVSKPRRFRWRGVSYGPAAPHSSRPGDRRRGLVGSSLCVFAHGIVHLCARSVGGCRRAAALARHAGAARGHPIPAVALGAVDVSPDAQQLAMTVESDERRRSVAWRHAPRRYQPAVSRWPQRQPNVASQRSRDCVCVQQGRSVQSVHSSGRRRSAPGRCSKAHGISSRHRGPRRASIVIHRVSATHRRRRLDSGSRQRRTAAGRAYALRRIACTVFSRRSMARVHVERIGPMGRVRAACEGAVLAYRCRRHGGRVALLVVDGQTLYFNANGRAAAAAISTTPTLSVSAPLPFRVERISSLQVGTLSSRARATRRCHARPPRVARRARVVRRADETARLPA